jgi:hypothetical protein
MARKTVLPEDGLNLGTEELGLGRGRFRGDGTRTRPNNEKGRNKGTVMRTVHYASMRLECVHCTLTLYPLPTMKPVFAADQHGKTRIEQ